MPTFVSPSVMSTDAASPSHSAAPAPPGAPGSTVAAKGMTSTRDPGIACARAGAGQRAARPRRTIAVAIRRHDTSEKTPVMRRWPDRPRPRRRYRWRPGTVSAPSPRQRSIRPSARMPNARACRRPPRRRSRRAAAPGPRARDRRSNRGPRTSARVPRSRERAEPVRWTSRTMAAATRRAARDPQSPRQPADRAAANRSQRRHGPVGGQHAGLPHDEVIRLLSPEKPDDGSHRRKPDAAITQPLRRQPRLIELEPLRQQVPDGLMQGGREQTADARLCHDGFVSGFRTAAPSSLVAAPLTPKFAAPPVVPGRPIIVPQVAFLQTAAARAHAIVALSRAPTPHARGSFRCATPVQ